ncbi:MAG: hypothetical protein KJ609_07140 [Gammaproteobacteria bacterium]|jgi:hypothetical protein|uniref:Uncharacterized protein n=1 Tax=Marinomonas polaris DSM 16579 TaxID=1122206 RepID=A0A1M4YFI5_9GAMM|nr:MULTISPECIES: hypothetical protein [Marinomonas]MBU1296303.1 hypothetical protein [Gammaproteobacteria bacterium]MBU1468733.1 hypothetical protein [Gammaproteobacteria bacterium]MBU2022944.1 hypothetical protein [Gammaproteobacteria bacterium]MBU2238145.1 hypothetical protein [Gammaproteobacteria bacterium]MBU2318307.1 hypothetical protein [Gammaproteobacteria bacterium]
MSLLSSQNVQIQSAYAEMFDRLHAMSLAAWIQHYQAETVDLRYFFHSGWSS